MPVERAVSLFSLAWPVLVSGSPRFGIDGQPAGVVTESEAGFSQRRVKKMKV